jgi:hypothetical protein
MISVSGTARVRILPGFKSKPAFVAEVLPASACHVVAARASLNPEFALEALPKVFSLHKIFELDLILHFLLNPHLLF